MASNLGWSQRELVDRMSVDEVLDWMAYDTSNTEEFRQKIEKIPIAYSSADKEAEAIKAMFNAIGKSQ